MQPRGASAHRRAARTRARRRSGRPRNGGPGGRPRSGTGAVAPGAQRQAGKAPCGRAAVGAGAGWAPSVALGRVRPPRERAAHALHRRWCNAMMGSWMSPEARLHGGRQLRAAVSAVPTGRSASLSGVYDHLAQRGRFTRQRRRWLPPQPICSPRGAVASSCRCVYAGPSMEPRHGCSGSSRQCGRRGVAWLLRSGRSRSRLGLAMTMI